MTDPANFLSRWSRRKRTARRAEPEKASDKIADSVPKAASSEQADSAGDKNKSSPVAAKPDEPAFDISQLPSIDSITAETDIRAFLGTGVPSALRQAALRQAWSADPKIRDFIEMAENQFDFNAGGEILGFDLSAPTGDIKRMIADIYGKTAESDSESAAQTGSTPPGTSPVTVERSEESEVHRNVTEVPAVADERPAADSTALQITEASVRQTVVALHEEPNAASQNNDAVQEENNSPPRRSHGRAMPK